MKTGWQRRRTIGFVCVEGMFVERPPDTHAMLKKFAKRISLLQFRVIWALEMIHGVEQLSSASTT